MAYLVGPWDYEWVREPTHKGLEKCDSVPLKVEAWRVWVLIRDVAVGPKRRPIPKEIVPVGIFDGVSHTITLYYLHALEFSAMSYGALASII